MGARRAMITTRTMHLRLRVARVVGAALGALALAALSGVAGCSTETGNGEACYPGDRRECACPGGAVGVQRCALDGSGYAAPDGSGACDCSGKAVAVCSTATVPVCEGASGKLPITCPCTKDDECESGMCFAFSAKGMRCTHACTAGTADVDCPSPSCACNNQNVCKVP